jgi:predicted dehydrogenase
MTIENSFARSLRLGVIGAGFWCRYQLAAWCELPAVEIVAICDREITRAHEAAQLFKIPAVYSDAAEMLSSERLDFLDITAGPDAHAGLVFLAAARGLPVICQKPMAPDFETCLRMVHACERTRTPFFIHENFRWQTPMRTIRAVLQEGRIGRPFRAHIQFGHGPIELFDNQPYLYQRPHFALEDMGPHLLDLARFFFGEPFEIYARQFNVNPRFLGEDIVSVFLSYERLYCHCELTWAAGPYECLVEGDAGVVLWDGRSRVQVTSGSETTVTELRPKHFTWADPSYGFAHPSIVAANRNLLAALRGEEMAETTGRENLGTMWLLDLALHSAATGRALEIGSFNTIEQS